MKITEMAFDPGSTSKFIHSTRRKWIETGDPEIDAILPDLSVGEQSYLEYITSQSYQKMVERLENYFGTKASRITLPSLMAVFVEALQQAIELEHRHKEKLEFLALSCVLSLDEFEMVKEAYEDGQLKFEVSLRPFSMPSLGDSNEVQESGLTEAEELNMELGEELMKDARLNRRFANMMIQGGAMLKMYLYNLVVDKLKTINPQLVKYYSAIAVMAQVGYWLFPKGNNAHLVQMADEIKGGQEQVEPEDTVYVIKATGMCFPYLVHEIVKGIYEWLSLSKEHSLAYEQDTISDEIDDTIVGTGLFSNIQKMVKNQKLFPLVYKKIIRSPLSTKKEILSGSPRGLQILASLEREAEEEWQEYQSQKAQEEEPTDEESEEESQLD